MVGTKFIKFMPTINGYRVPTEGDTIEAGAFFEGEEVILIPNATVNGGKAVDAKLTITVSGDEGNYRADEEIKIPISGNGKYAITASGDGLTPTTATIRINVRKWVASPAESGNRTISAVTPIPGTADAALIGFRGNLSETGDLYIKKVEVKGDSIASTLYPINFQSIFEEQPQFRGVWNSKITRMLENFPVNSITFDVSGKILVGVPAGVVYADDFGTGWKGLGNLSGLIHNPEQDYPGYHRGCKGHRIDGWKDLVVGGLQDTCDILVDEDGTLYVATSNVVTSLQHGVEAYLTNKANPDNTWAGTPGPGQASELTFQTVNHNLEKVDGKLFSASDRGLLVSHDKGIHWSYAGDLKDTPVISVTVDKVGDRLFAGSESSLYTCDINGTKCSKLSGVSGPVYDIKVDPLQAGTIYAATANGLKVSRNLGRSWTDILKGRIDDAVAVEKLAVGKVKDRVGIFAAAGPNIFASIATVKGFAPANAK